MSEDELNLIKMPFDVGAQSAVIGWCLKNREFCFKCKQHVVPDMFVNEILADVFSVIMDFIKTYNDLPSKENLISLFSHKTEFILYKQTINDCVALSSKFNLNFIQNGLNDWLKIAVIREYHIKAAKHYRNTNIPVLKGLLKTALDKINEVNFTKSLQYEFGNAVAALTKANDNLETCVTTGMTEFDAAMGGGLFRGEQTIVIAPVSVGKTALMLNMIYHNIMADKKCLFLIHEGVPDEIAVKLRQRFLKMTYVELLNLAKNGTKEQIELLNTVENILKESLMFIPLLKAGGLYIEDVVDIVKIEQERLFSREGRYYDLIISDYPARLMSKELSKNTETRNVVRHIYSEMQRLAMEFQCHAISPLQVNRAGFKSNKEREPGEYLDLDNASESFGVPMDADNVMILNRSDVDAKNEILYVHVAKTRRNKNKQIIQFSTDYSRIITHDPSLGCTVLTAGTKSLKQIMKEEIKDLTKKTENTTLHETEADPVSVN